jgi:hypothetical protein
LIASCMKSIDQASLIDVDADSKDDKAPPARR